MTAAPQIEKTEAEKGFEQAFDAHRAKLPGNDWARQQREAAIRRFGELGLPHRRVEAWKYTDLRLLLKEALTPSQGSSSPVSDKDLYAALGGDLHGVSAHHLVFVDGVHDEANSFIISDEAGLIDMTPLAEVLDQPPAWFQRNFNQINPQEDDPIVALNTAFMRDGAVIEIMKGAKLKRPVHIIHLSSAPAGEAITERNFIHLEEGAEATILESHVHLRSPDVQRNCVTEISLEEGARANHIKFQHEGANASHLSNWMVSVGSKATYRAFQFNIGAGLSRNSVNLRFTGEHAKADLSGVALLWDKQHSDTTLNVVHAVPHCESRELYKCVLDDQARAVFQGKLVVAPDAQKTDAEQMARGLLLSEQAEFDAKPELEIYADDVVCGHGATSGELDDEMMFYMRQRGMSKETARGLLILAFIGEVLECVENEDIRAAFQTVAEAWLGAQDND